MSGTPTSFSGEQDRGSSASASGLNRGFIGADSSSGRGGLGNRLSSVSPAGRSSEFFSSSRRDYRRGQGGTVPWAGTHAGGDSGKKSAAASSENSSGGGGGKLGAAPWLARGLKALVRGGRGGDTGTQLPSLGAVMDAVDARGAQDEVVAAAGRSKMEGVMSSELPAHPQVGCGERREG